MSIAEAPARNGPGVEGPVTLDPVLDAPGGAPPPPPPPEQPPPSASTRTRTNDDAMRCVMAVSVGSAAGRVAVKQNWRQATPNGYSPQHDICPNITESGARGQHRADASPARFLPRLGGAARRHP